MGRKFMSKIIALISIIDDIYDVYGTVEELQLFNDAIERWEKVVSDQLPEYMKYPYPVILDTIKQTLDDELAPEGNSFDTFYIKEAVEHLDECFGDLLPKAHELYRGDNPIHLLDLVWTKIIGRRVLSIPKLPKFEILEVRSAGTYKKAGIVFKGNQTKSISAGIKLENRVLDLSVNALCLHETLRANLLVFENLLGSLEIRSYFSLMSALPAFNYHGNFDFLSRITLASSQRKKHVPTLREMVASAWKDLNLGYLNPTT
ncbi:beta-cubebene synthase-like [Aristolochia californica]|uniref:beta-cubebene synthase-like n=1 Tax=Aristolochia californica TaxID=171875 RepID=UPI0035DCA989